MDDKYLGKGIYSIAYASKLSGIHTAKINRWVRGLKRKDKFLRVELLSAFASCLILV